MFLCCDGSEVKGIVEYFEMKIPAENFLTVHTLSTAFFKKCTTEKVSNFSRTFFLCNVRLLTNSEEILNYSMKKKVRINFKLKTRI